MGVDGRREDSFSAAAAAPEAQVRPLSGGGEGYGSKRQRIIAPPSRGLGGGRVWTLTRLRQAGAAGPLGPRPPHPPAWARWREEEEEVVEGKRHVGTPRHVEEWRKKGKKGPVQ